MKNGLFVLMLVAVLAAAVLPGCGNVSLKGDAMTAAQNSAMNAYQADIRAEKDPAVPAWLKAYLAEDFKQWRFFVRSANKDMGWGPRLPEEQAAKE
jgi:hypothetical protein